MSSNLSSFVFKFSPVYQYLRPLFKKKRHRFCFLPVKLCTVKVSIFLCCDFIFKFTFSNMHCPAHV